MIALEKIQQIERKIQEQGSLELSFRNFEGQPSQRERVDSIIQAEVHSLDEKLRQRILGEFNSWGPITELLEDEAITEILINGPQSIWYEKQGSLHAHEDAFGSAHSYENFIARLCQTAQVHFTLDLPMVDGNFFNFRLHLISQEITKSSTTVSLRRHPQNAWTLKSLAEHGWAEPEALMQIQNLLHERENFLVVGSTGSGKTSVLNACLQYLPANERAVIIEDTSELKLPNSASSKLISRRDANSALTEINQAELLRQSLRMRPDRLVMGEVRGAEAKDLLMALSTGHSGSFASLHASDPHQALIRLEMLIQLGAPYWSLDAIRNLIFLSLQKIIVVARDSGGARVLQGIYKLSSREESGILIERVG